MRLAHLSRAWGSADGGVAVAVQQLLAAQGALPLPPALLWSTPAASDGLAADLRAFGPDLLHVHGLWRAPNRLAFRLQRQLPVVLAPHGMLDPGALAISRRKKQLVWRLWERRALAAARCIHALCPAEAAAIRALLPQAPVDE